MEQQHALITLDEMDFYAYHGCYEQEKIVGTRFTVNVAIEVDIALAAQTDKVTDALNYVEVYQVVKKEMEQPSNLLENVASRIINTLRERFPAIIKASVKVSKVNPPVGGSMKSVSVAISR